LHGKPPTKASSPPDSRLSANAATTRVMDSGYDVDADGLWSSVCDHILSTAGPVVWAQPTTHSYESRVRELIDLLWKAPDSPSYAARAE
jgi:hypothetical protein